MLTWMWVVWVPFGIFAVGEFVRYAKTKDKRALFYACCFLMAFILGLVSAGIFEGWFIRSN
jgi:hypothetical protein